MEYQPSYFEDEVRDGFFVPSIIKKSWASAMKIYEDLQAICNFQEVNCAAAYGTLMGAVRHGGFIPWDDDVDVMIIRDEFARLATLREEKRLGKCKIVDYTGGKTTDMVRGFTNYEKSSDDLEDHFGFPFGDMIDLFVYDYIPEKSDEREKFQKKLDILFQKYYQAEHSKERIQALSAIEEYCSGFTRDKCNERAMIPDWFTRTRTQSFENWAYEEYIEIPFELGTIRVPIGYDYILKKIYGNYMSPQIAKSGHGYPFFAPLEKQLWEEYGERLLRYSYDRKEIRKIRQKNKEKKSLKKELVSSIDLLGEAHSFVRINYQREEMLPAIIDTLGQCQELAIHLGKQIEEQMVKPEEVISVLEGYCDTVYRVFKILSGEADADIQQSVMEKLLLQEIDQLSEYEKKMRINTQLLEEKKEIVFLVYKTKYWKAVQTLWEEASGRDDTLVTVIPVPYYYRKYNGELEKDMHIEQDYPKEVVLTSYEDYNFEIHHPDTVVYQFPYDEYNYALSLHPFYYTSNLRQYTEQMVYVPPYLLREETDSGRVEYTLKWLLCTPGLMYADKIYVQSEQMKNLYAKILDDFTGHDKKMHWDKRLDSSRFPLREWEKRQNIDTITDMAETWRKNIIKPNGEKKKIILYYVSGSVLYEYRDIAIEKMKQVLEIAKKNRDDILFLLIEDPYARDVIMRKIPKVWGAYQNLKKSFVDEGVGEICKDEDNKLAVRVCDAFYGDAGTIMSECRMSGKPIMWANMEIDII